MSSGRLAQLVERRIYTANVAGSIPASSTHPLFSSLIICYTPIHYHHMMINSLKGDDMSHLREGSTTRVDSTLGAVIALIGGLIAIGLCVAFHQTWEPLLAIILVGYGVQKVRTSPRPTVLGLLIGLLYLLVGVVAYYLQNAGVLWSMILVNLFADDFIK
jgi:hypothetical protein